MKNGKEICNELKAVRRSIAEENGIALEIPDCPHQGPCPGTCPQCEKELWQLETALAQRISVGKVATVAGIALALALPAAAQVQSPKQEGKRSDKVERKQQVKLYPVQGTIVDVKTKEPLPFCNVVVTRIEERMKVVFPQNAVTDFDGVFKMELPEGNYILQVSYVGYKPIEMPMKVLAKNDTVDIGLEMTSTILGVPEVIICGIFDNPIIEIGPEGSMNTKIQGVPLRIQY